VKPVLYAKSDAGHYTLEQGFEVAEKIDLATAYAEEMDDEGDQPRPLSRASRFANMGGPGAQGSPQRRQAVQGSRAMGVGRPSDHQSRECGLSLSVTCANCGKLGHVKKACWEVNPSLKPDWARSKEPLRGQARAAAIADLERQVADTVSAQM
jgi:hypothetical protein